MDPWTGLELALAVLAGVVVGWVLRAQFHRARGAKRALQPPGPIVTSSPREPGRETPPRRAPAPEPADVAPKLSREADTAGRVITHLASLGRLGNDEVARLGFTQKGIGEALTVRQGTLAKVLSRLEAARVIEVDRRHVEGQPRRLNVYRLTALGESVARDLRHRRAVPLVLSGDRAVPRPQDEPQNPI